MKKKKNCWSAPWKHPKDEFNALMISIKVILFSLQFCSTSVEAVKFKGAGFLIIKVKVQLLQSKIDALFIDFLQYLIISYQFILL